MRVFSSHDYENADFEVIAETVTGVNASVAGDINMLDTVLNSGHISLESYINAYPEDALTDKRKMLDLIKKEKESEAELLRAQLKEMSERLNKAEATIKENEDTVSRAVSAIKENLSLKEFIAKEYENGK